MNENPRPNRDSRALSRRNLLGAGGVAAGLMAVSPGLSAAVDGEKSTRENTEISRRTIRVSTVCFGLPFHDHRKDGVNLQALREMTAKVMQDRPNFICYPEICACSGSGFEKGMNTAPDLEPYVAEVGKIAREFGVALIAPFLEHDRGKVFNSVPIVDKSGKLVLVYRKNYPTTGELEAGITPGSEVPVAECDGVRVGATVCFDANFDFIAADLERQRARLVFWPSMYWGGKLLQHWALRYGFAIAVAYGAESAVIDMNGQYLARQGTDTLKVRQGLLPPWATADIRINREVYHLDFNQNHFPAIREKYGPLVGLEVLEPEGYFLMESLDPEVPVERIAEEFKLETLRDYLARSVKMRNSILNSSPVAG